MAEIYSDTDRHQINRILDRMFQYGQDGRDLGRYLIAAKNAPEPYYQPAKLEILELLSKKLDLLYLADPPRQS